MRGADGELVLNELGQECGEARDEQALAGARQVEEHEGGVAHQRAGRRGQLAQAAERRALGCRAFVSFAHFGRANFCCAYRYNTSR